MFDADEIWTIDALEEAVYGLPGKPVRKNFQGPIIGYVVDAEADDEGLKVTLCLQDGQTFPKDTKISIRSEPSKAQRLHTAAEETKGSEGFS